MRTLHPVVRTGKIVFDDPGAVEEEEWKEAVVLGALVARSGGEVRISRTSLISLTDATLHVEHHLYSDEIVLRLERRV